MANKNTLNKSRLNKKQVQELLQNEGIIHDEYSKIFEETYASGFVKQDLVYELSNDRYLYVFDPAGMIIPGKGDIYAGAYFRKWVEFIRWALESGTYSRGSSADHWLYHSKHKAGIIEHIDTLISELATVLSIENDRLDKSYASLDILSNRIAQFGRSNTFSTLYDNLVAYIGEVIRVHINGVWKVTQLPNSNSACPSIYLNGLGIHYSVINAVWAALHSIEINLRAETTKIVRQNGWQVKHRKHNKRMKYKGGYDSESGTHYVTSDGWGEWE